MRAFVVVLVVAVFTAFYGANWLADGSRFTPAAVNYMLMGALIAALAAFNLALMLEARPSPWRSVSMAALVVAIIEGLQMPVCRFFVDDINNVNGKNLCDYVTGWPVTFFTISLEVCIVIYILWAQFRRRDGQ